jgi:hypothetical protein
MLRELARTQMAIARDHVRARVGLESVQRSRGIRTQGRVSFAAFRCRSFQRQPSESDADCRVHGVSNLHVAGSSVFPTFGVTNPTCTTLALALRFAQHLEGHLA